MNSAEQDYRNLELVREDGDNIKYIKNPSPDLMFEAVASKPYAIMYIKDPDEATQLMAVRKKPSAIVYIKYPTQKVIDVSNGIDPEIDEAEMTTLEWLSEKVKSFFGSRSPLDDYRPRH